MTRRVRVLLSGGTMILVVAAIARSLALEPLRPPATNGSSALPWEADDKSPMVMPSFESPPEKKQPFQRFNNFAALVVIHGQAFDGDAVIPRDKIKDYLNAKVRSGEIKYVLLAPEAGTKHGEMMSVVDEARKSQVETIYLNQIEW